MDIDYNGDVRGLQELDIHFTPMETLLVDIAHSLLYINSVAAKPLHIDVYTSDIQLIKFFKNVISKMFEQAVWKSTSSRRIVASTVYADRVQFSVGTTILEDLPLTEPLKGIILDMSEVEKTKIEIEDTLDRYDWCAVIVPHLESFFKAKDKAFYINILSNKSLIELFEFIFAHSLTLIESKPKETEEPQPSNEEEQANYVEVESSGQEEPQTEEIKDMIPSLRDQIEKL
jgi:hypothetical protein